ncbi:carboxypeptidase-like regulatory domain-containing protein [Bacteroides sp.]|uniref:carboxypeptidase-like regulatory domain-containing protein n=2 Tax=Bacteroides sp. TaxID=29523 RepID=UPI001B759092|nr:carboxypeptidase-like regulatory domain-containing protein [Bacteroides sp.]MBP6066128.1 carboxypeptidase-like regulatory domain-containing protein [Bacteroides sp.]MBP6936948.1 carboxypeptidase-like regulatory domain-containing protein [Bacteroides sp.]
MHKKYNCQYRKSRCQSVFNEWLDFINQMKSVILIIFTKKLLCIVAMALCSWFHLSAQLKGRVLDAQTNTSLAGVNIYFTPHKGLTVTNTDGDYILPELALQNSADSICFSYIGYFTQKLSKQNLQDNNYLVLLAPSTQKLGEITVDGKMPLLKSFVGFEKMASMLRGLSSFGSTLHDGKLYVTGGDTGFIIR